MPGSQINGTTGSRPVIRVGGQNQGGLEGGSRRPWQERYTEHQRWRLERQTKMSGTLARGDLTPGLKARAGLQLLEEC